MLEEMKKIALDMLEVTWPMLVISIIIVTSLRITYIIVNKEKFVLYKELFKLAFIIYVLCLFQIVTAQDVNYGGMNFIPFKEIFRYEPGSYLFYKNILGNMLLFLPFGLFVGCFTKLKNPLIMFILAIIASVSIETTQLAIGRIFDVDDIILNIFGAMLGFLLYKLLDNFNGIIPEKLKKSRILNIITIILILVLVRFLIPWKNLMFIMKQIMI